MRDLFSAPTRALLVQPRFSGRGFWNCTGVCRLTGARYPAAPLGLLTVATLMPQHWRFRLVDENVRPLTGADIEWAGIVLTGGMLPQQAATLAVMAKARAAGRPVVLGGPDATEQPWRYEGAGYLVLGEGEVTIPMFLADLARGASSGVYRSDEKADMTKTAVPRFELIRFRDYIQVGIQFSRGCPYNCESCDIIELYSHSPRTKEPAQVIAELEALYDIGYRGHIGFVDDNLIGHRAGALEVLAVVADWSRRHGYPFYLSTEASVNLAAEKGLLELMRECDFRYVFPGIESPDDRVLERAKKTQNVEVPVPEAVRTITSYGMVVNAGFILGLDGESPDAADGIIRLIEEAGICLAMFGALYALPGTRLTRRLEAEGRLFHKGRKTVDALLDIDQTTSGLNFVTSPPRAAILEDQVKVLRHIYRPAHYYGKVLLTALSLRPARRHRVGFGEAVRLARGFVRLSAKAGFNHRTGKLYWKTLFLVLMGNSAAIDTAANLAAMYLHFSRQSYYATGVLERAARRVRRIGEERRNAMMVRGARHGEANWEFRGESGDTVNDRRHGWESWTGTSYRLTALRHFRLQIGGREERPWPLRQSRGSGGRPARPVLDAAPASKLGGLGVCRPARVGHFLTHPAIPPIIAPEEYPCPKEHTNRQTSAASVLTGSAPACRRPVAVTSFAVAAQRVANASPYEWRRLWLESKSCAGSETWPGSDGWVRRPARGSSVCVARRILIRRPTI